MMWLALIITFIILVLMVLYFYKTKEGIEQLKWILIIFVALLIINDPNIQNIIISKDRLEIVKKEVEKVKAINEETKKLAVKTADLVALMSSYTGWGFSSIPIRKERLSFYKSALEGTSELMKSSGLNPSDFQSIRELKGIVTMFERKPNETPETRPSSRELESLAAEGIKRN